MLYIFLLPCCSWDTVAMCSGTMYMFHIGACYVWHKVEMCSFTTDLKLLLRLPGVQTPLLQLFLVTWHLHVVAASLFSTPLLRVPRAQDLRSCFGPCYSTNKAVLVQCLCAESAPSHKISCPTPLIESLRGNPGLSANERPRKKPLMKTVDWNQCKVHDPVLHLRAVPGALTNDLS